MARAVNSFYEGLDTDTSNTFIKNARFRGGKNVRLMGTEGKDFDATAMLGNHNEPTNGIGFNINDGWVPLAWATIKGVTFVYSMHPTANIGELGSFPSPPVGGGALERTYRPLRNFINATFPHSNFTAARQNFQTDLFNPQVKATTMMVVREDYDGSANIYLCDYQNPDRVFNCGFNIETGTYNDRRYTETSFTNLVHLYNETNTPPDVYFVELGDNGKLKCGNTFVHFRYTDEQYNPTSFNTVVGPIPIGIGNLLSPATYRGGEGDEFTDKSIRLDIDIDTLDRNYRYLQVALVRYFTDESADALLISERFVIEDIVSSPLVVNRIINTMHNNRNINAFRIEITGRENTATLSVDEVVAQKRIDEVSKSFDVFEGRLWRVNTKSSNEDEEYQLDALRDFAQTMFLTEATESRECHGNPTGIDNNSVSMTQRTYLDPVQVESRVGYFRSEAYPFGVCFLLANGKLTETFPVRGNSTVVSEQLDGVFRFTTNALSPYINDVGGQTSISILHPVLNYDFTVPQFTGNQWLVKNVVGFYVMRGPRIVNRIITGLMCPVYDGRGYDRKEGYDDDTGCFEFPNLFKDTGGIKDCFKDIVSVKKTPFWQLVPRCVDNVAPWVPFMINNGTKVTIGGELKGGWFSNTAVPMGRDLYELVAGVPRWTNAVLATTITHLRFWGPTYYYPHQVDHNMAIFCPDFMFSNKFFDRSYFVLAERKVEFHNVIQNFHFNTISYYADMRSPIAGVGGALVDNGSVFRCDAYGCLLWQAADKGGFVSYYNEASDITAVDVDDDDNSTIKEEAGTKADFYFAWHYSKRNCNNKRRQAEIRSLAMGFPPYIGIKMLDAPSGTFLLPYRNGAGVTDAEIQNRTSHILSLYQTHPANYNPFVLIDVSATRYGKISALVRRNTFPTGTINLFKGDCFINRVYFKTLQNPIYDVNSKADAAQEKIDSSQSYITFGNVLGVVLELTHNSNYRLDGKDVKEPNDIRETFWPKHDPANAVTFACQTRGKESYNFNTGYNRVLDAFSVAGFDRTLPIPLQQRRHITRMVYSGKHLAGSYIDGWRIAGQQAHQDFDIKLGDIFCVHGFQRKLITLHHNGVLVHGVEERELKQGSSGTLEIATQIDTLSPKPLVVSDRQGCQHTSASIVTENGIYFLDFDRRNICMVNPSGQLNIISSSKSVATKLKDFINARSHRSDGSFNFPESVWAVDPTLGNIIMHNGFSFGYNKRYDEVYFSIIHEDDNLTMGFSERAMAFFPDPQFHSPCYILNNEDFFSCSPHVVVNGLVQNSEHHAFYLHDYPLIESSVPKPVHNYLRYYGRQVVGEWVFVVNLEPEVIKLFDYMHINCGQEKFSEVLYETEFQQAIQNPFEDPNSVGFKPRYQEDAWKVPIKRADVLKTPHSSHYQVQSPLRGKWLKVTLRYDPVPSQYGDRYIQYIKSVETYLKPAFI